MNELKQQIEKKLHACNTDLFIEWHKEHPNDPYLHRLHSKLQIMLDGFVCIPRKQLEEYRQGHVSACHCSLCELLRKVGDSK